MDFQQRDVVRVEYLLPDGKSEIHPYLIISCRAASSKESYYTAVMMTASKFTDLFTFSLQNNMFESPLEKSGCQLRLYILVSFHKDKIKSLLTRMKPIHFKAVLQQIKDYVLSMDT